MESTLEHAAEVDRKTYRESLQNNRNAILISKQLVTIDTNVAVDFEPEKMRAQEPDATAARSLFTELEFTTLVQDFLSESIELGETDYREPRTPTKYKPSFRRRRREMGCSHLRWSRRQLRQPLPRRMMRAKTMMRDDQLSLGAAPPLQPRNCDRDLSRRPSALPKARRWPSHSMMRNSPRPCSRHWRTSRSPRPFTTTSPQHTFRASKELSSPASSTIPCSTPIYSIPPTPRTACPRSRFASSA